MNFKLFIFFLVALFILLYLSLFWRNRHQKVEFHFFRQKVEMSLGLLVFGVFLDGAILTALLFWLFL